MAALKTEKDRTIDLEQQIIKVLHTEEEIHIVMSAMVVVMATLIVSTNSRDNIAEALNITEKTIRDTIEIINKRWRTDDNAPVH